MADDLVPSKPGEFLLYQTDDGTTRVQVRFEGDTVWLSQKEMAELFQKDVRTISEHIRNIFEEGELRSESVIRNFRITAADAKQYDTQHYNLDVIISVGYRVKSLRGTQFRIWATQQLREYIIKGFTLDDERFKGLPYPRRSEALLSRKFADIGYIVVAHSRPSTILGGDRHEPASTGYIAVLGGPQRVARTQAAAKSRVLSSRSRLPS